MTDMERRLPGVAKRVEGKIEEHGRKYMEARRGLHMKFVSPGNNGVPDRVLSHWRCGPFLVEYKEPGKKPKKHQASMQEDLARAGWTVFACVDSYRMIETIIDEMLTNTPHKRMTHKPVQPL